MGTDRHENDIKRKGRPSGKGKSGNNLRDAFAVNELGQEDKTAEKYLEAGEEPAENVRLKNPNRNPNKGNQE
ncbi:hypothetical protein SAMN05421747_10944 [Parapedobacter composti]|uniref:Uncharacterized protein n=1 Tax=Parapedobacter composti TaxID=623281 RepID=A0A1I1IFT7_9SPHI|nr:hypothetical protein [Parapedobacter composti]SFC35137.1 hypothetical protein SAMN05421747_10944 [Parapedobacter composti]